MRQYLHINGKKVRADCDPFETCVKCEWRRLRKLPRNGNSFDAYACMDCGLFWWEELPGVLTCDNGGKIMIPLTNHEDPFRG